MVFIQYGSLLAIRNRRVSILQSNPLWGPRRNLIVPCGMVGTALIAVTNLYGPGLQAVFNTTPIPAMFWGPPFGFALGILIMDELRKLIVRTYPKVSDEWTCATMLSDGIGLVNHCQDGMVTYCDMIPPSPHRDRLINPAVDKWSHVTLAIPWKGL